ncbi:MAG TPA: MurR/RpiR family transcriptional regulator [Acidimicrobiales bacterium]|nr:MurR/RpiR family transcriptional regulator [Acidimicrobiales bacterium]
MNGVVERIKSEADRLTATERKIAAVLADEPHTVAFGTVAEVARRAGTSGPSVVRLATKLGYEGFVGLQAAVQAELTALLGPARDRIRQRPPSDIVGRAHDTEVANLAQTFDNLDRDALRRAVDLLADPARRVWIHSGLLTAPVGAVLATTMAQLRPAVTLLGGSNTTVGLAGADLCPGDVVVAVDIHRYERSLVRAVSWARNRGAEVVALTDSPLSPLAGLAAETFFISARGAGPFDSMVGGVALANLLVAATAAKVRHAAAGRLDAVEGAWRSLDSLVASDGGRPARPERPPSSAEAATP